MNNNNHLPFIAVVIFIAAMGFFIHGAATAVNIFEKVKYVIIAGQNIKVDLALNKKELQEGLGGRIELKESEGMLFVFNYSGKYPFWMKDMNFPIDIIWIGEDMRVVYIKKDARPALFLDTYGPDQDAKFVLEVVAGFSDKNNLKVGDSVYFLFQ